MRNRTIGFYDNPYTRQEIYDRLSKYDPAGMRVRFNLGFYSGKGHIIRAMGGGPGGFFLIEIDPEDRITFSEYARNIHKKDVKSIYWQLRGYDCIGKDRKTLECIWAQWHEVVLIGFKKGMPVEYVVRDPGDITFRGITATPGIVQNAYKMEDGTKIVEMFLLEPMSPTRAPRVIEMNAIKPEHISKYTDRLSIRTYVKWEALSPQSLPPGSVVNDEYVLPEPIEIEKVKEFCKKYIPALPIQDICWLSSALFHVLPINPENYVGKFHPMRTTVASMHIDPSAMRIARLKEAVTTSPEPEKFPMRYVMTKEDVEHHVRWIKFRKRREEAGLPEIPYEEWLAMGEPEA